MHDWIATQQERKRWHETLPLEDEKPREPQYSHGRLLCYTVPLATPLTTAAASIDGSNSNLLSGFMRNASTTPRPIKSMLPTNGNSQLPKRSMRYPPATGEIMAAKAEPVFIMPLAVPENSGAMSMGMDHIGPIVNSAKKKPA